MWKGKKYLPFLVDIVKQGDPAAEGVVTDGMDAAFWGVEALFQMNQAIDAVGWIVALQQREAAIDDVFVISESFFVVSCAPPRGRRTSGSSTPFSHLPL